MAKKITLTLDFEKDLESVLKKKHPEMVDFRILSQSLDARNSNRGRRPQFQYQVEVIAAGETFSPFLEEFKKLENPPCRPIIIGAGPAGLFAALRLSEYGIRCLILERGEEANKRMLAISRFWRKGQLNPNSNVCYGEGGAGLFSDGKLITRVRSPHIPYVMQRLVDFGAPPDTAYLSNPHLGSNKIRPIITKLVQHLKNCGSEIRYNSTVEKILVDAVGDQKQQMKGVQLSNGETILSPMVILATGHSAFHVYEELLNKNVRLKAKDFAIGVRIEHARSTIDKLQHGDFCSSPILGAARYRLSYENPQTKKGTYSFCMCPGGYVLSSGTESDGLVVNGMSNYARSSPWSNSALVVAQKVGVDFEAAQVLAGAHYIRQVEKKAYSASLSSATGREIPAQRLLDFLDNKKSLTLPRTSCPSGIFSSELTNILPDSVTQHLHQALRKFDHQLKGFISDQALLLAPETRTSSPLTVVRDPETLQSENTFGLYPCGEGAGYAGGITSAAADGVKVAEALLLSMRQLA